MSLPKARYELLPYDALDMVARVFGEGGAKHGDRNWETSAAPNGGPMIGAAFRHLSEYQQGSTTDGDSGYHPLAHAAARVLMELALSLRGRPTTRPEIVQMQPGTWTHEGSPFPLEVQ